MLDVKHLTVSFKSRLGKNIAVDDVSFTLNKGDTLGIVGESGSGKSVTCYSLLGLIPSPPGCVESGTATYKGQELLGLPEKEKRTFRGAKIAMIFQDPMTSLNPYMRIGDQILESLQLHNKSLNKKDGLLKAQRALEEVGIDAAEHRLKSYPHEFSGGMRQRVMIAMALATEPEVLIADEPTTALDVTIQAQILALLADIQKRRDLSIIFISHDLAVVKKIANYVLVMKDGKVVERGEPKDLFNHPQHDYTQKLIAAIPTKAKPWKFDGNINDILLNAKHVSTTFKFTSGPFWAKKTHRVNAVEDVSLSISKGEILGLVGESGSGKSSFGRSIMRLVEAESGTILFEDADLLQLNDTELKSARKRFQMIFQDPYASLNPRMTVFDALAEPMLTHKLFAPNQIEEEVNKLMDDVGLERTAIRKYPHEFSGGQRQRIAIARALACQPSLIIADEPVSALDVTIQAQVLELLLNLSRQRNLTMLFISHDLSVVRYLCDRVAVMRAGSVIELNDCETLFNAPQHEYTKKLLNAIAHLN